MVLWGTLSHDDTTPSLPMGLKKNKSNINIYCCTNAWPLPLPKHCKQQPSPSQPQEHLPAELTITAGEAIRNHPQLLFCTLPSLFSPPCKEFVPRERLLLLAGGGLCERWASQLVAVPYKVWSAALPFLLAHLPCLRTGLECK